MAPKGFYIYVQRKLRSPIGIISDVEIFNSKVAKEEGSQPIFSCHALENREIGIEREADLAIPNGVYQLGVHTSSRFRNSVTGPEMILVFNEDVPRDRCILIHAGNHHLDTAGCILLGRYDKSKERFIDSRTNVDAFYKALKLHEKSKMAQILSDSTLEINADKML